ncbi:FG-GAP repeat domain-containing protein [Pseudoroseicyclus sp. H15]
MRWAALFLAAMAGNGAAAQESLSKVVSAEYAEPTDRYDHGVLGDAIEWGALTFRVNLCPACANVQLQDVTIRLPDTRVFEDVAPRLADLTGDGSPEAIVVESDLSLGARLAVYGPEARIAATEFIGQSHRWLAPVGAADLDGDGQVEIAYVDRPHLTRVLRVVRLQGDRLVQVAALEGVTNHRIGDESISGGVRDCGEGPEMILLSPDWQRLIAVRFDGTGLSTREIGPATGPASIAAALSCAAP